ncbi:MAG: hypothetical protein ABFC77_07285 [Thermoguttaceae bacterium]
MNGLDFSTIAWLLIAVQLFGFFSAWTARLSEGSKIQTVGQYLFFVALPLMGGVTVAAFTIGPGCWLLCCATLATMILTVTCDFRKGREAATW